MKNAIIIDSNSLNKDLDFRLDFKQLFDLILTLTKGSIDNTEIFYFDNEDAAKHTFHYSIEQKNYKLKIKPADYKFKQPEYVQCHCCETLVLDPATNKKVFNLDLGVEIANFVHLTTSNFDKFNFVTSNGDFVALANYLESIGKLDKIILPDSRTAGEFILKNISDDKIVKLENYHTQLGREMETTKFIEKEKPSAITKFGKKK